MADATLGLQAVRLSRSWLQNPWFGLLRRQRSDRSSVRTVPPALPPSTPACRWIALRCR